MDGQTLRDREVRTTADLQKVLPGLVVNDRGSQLYSSFTVRGLTSFDFYNPSVQVLVDGVPQASSALARELYDVERVEFLRGPQGTLYGINAFAGVINIVTAKPRENQAEIYGTASNRLFEAGTNTTGVIVPETVFLDLGIKEKNVLGQLTDIDRGRNNIDGYNALTGYATLRYAPAGGPFDATMSVSHDALRSNEEAYILDRDLHRRAYQSGLLGPYNVLDREISTASLNWNYRFADFTLSNITSVQDVDVTRRLFGGRYPESYRNIYEELRLAYDGAGPLKGVAGLTVFNNDFEREQPGFAGFTSASTNKVTARSLAAFGEATYALTDRLDLTAGARVSYDQAEITFQRPDIDGNGFGLGFDRTADFTELQPKVSLGYQLNDQTRLYGLVSEGYKPGGFNHTVTSAADAVAYRPETAWNFEVGGRTSLLDDRVTLSSAIYHVRSQDQQIYVGPVGLQVLRNAGQGVSTGIELEAAVRATDRLTLTAQGAFGHSEFSNDRDPLTGIRYDGKQTPFAPNAVANLGTQYRIAQDWVPADVTLLGNMRLTSRTYFDVANSLSQGGFTTYDTGLQFAFRHGVTAHLFATNLTDKTYRTYSFTSGPVTLSSIGQGRVVGGDVRVRF